MPASELLPLSARELFDRGLWPDPDDTYADVNLVSGAEEITVTAAYNGPINDDGTSRREIEKLLFRRLNFIYQGGLLSRVPDAATSGKALVVLLLLPDDELPAATVQMLTEYNDICTERGIGMRVIQVPRETL